MAKLPRKAMMTYIDASFGGNSPSWFLIGKDVEDMSVELNSDTEQTTNILDETTTTDNGYKPTISVDTYKANPSDGDFYDAIMDIMMNRKTGDACKTKILEIIVEDTSASSHDAWTEDVIVKPNSYGGATGAISIPYTISFDGNRKAGTAALSSATPPVPTFTAASGG